MFHSCCAFRCEVSFQDCMGYIRRQWASQCSVYNYRRHLVQSRTNTFPVFVGLAKLASCPESITNAELLRKQPKIFYSNIDPIASIYSTYVTIGLLRLSSGTFGRTRTDPAGLGPDEYAIPSLLRLTIQYDVPIYLMLIIRSNYEMFWSDASLLYFNRF